MLMGFDDFVPFVKYSERPWALVLVVRIEQNAPTMTYMCDLGKMTKPPQIAILGAGIFVRTQYIPRLTEISDLVVLKAIWSRTEESARGAVEIAASVSQK
ncbi:hypothetical protein LOK49_LG11G00580 [Camellia lanceoleosa]|uniref:Uncharacterized protein n=1 Tax=Camellia lanceoleosa TaxID=1840588 RepID=A0ACC0G5K3_9ERIC|nr:hypothetical protein LOK49_LG11G00580 [Camellia lanceoleosa]